MLSDIPFMATVNRAGADTPSLGFPGKPAVIPGRLLTQFIVVAEELHFGRAASRLNMAQPPLSHAMRRLEEIVGVELFIRTTRSVRLSQSGMAFLSEARELVSRSERAIRIAQTASAGLSGRVAIGFVGSLGYQLLPELLHHFRSRFPRIEIELRESLSREQLEQLRARKLDIGIVRLPLGSTGDLALQVIRRERFVAVLPRAHPMADAPFLRLEQLAAEQFMAFPPDKVPSLHAKFLLACQEAGFSPNVTLEAWQISSVINLVAIGVGIALLPEQVRGIQHPGVVYKPLANRISHLDLEIAVACRQDDQTTGVQALLATLDSLGRSRKHRR